MDDREKLSKSRLLDFERPRLDDVLYHENNKPHGFTMDQNDGMPKPAVTSLITDTEAADLSPDRFVCMGRPGSLFPLRRARPSCEHYKRQLLPSEDKEHTICIRYCTAIKGESGEFMDLGNTEVLACSFRTPADPRSESRLEEFDLKLIERQKQRREEDAVFDVDAALEKK
jgi:hypothetical protein